MKKISFSLFILLGIFIIFTILFTEKGLTIVPQTENKNLPDFDNVAEEAAKDLQKYIQINTIRGNEIESANFLKTHFLSR